MLKDDVSEEKKFPGLTRFLLPLFFSSLLLYCFFLSGRKGKTSYSIKVLFSALLNKSAHSWDSGASSQSPFDHFMAGREFEIPSSMGPS